MSTRDIEDFTPCNGANSTEHDEHAGESPTPSLRRPNEEKQKKIIKCEVISATRRNDIPAFGMPRVVAAMKRGDIDVAGPRGANSRISMSHEDVKCIVWWSKDYAPWFAAKQENPELFGKYCHMFNFTLTGDAVLEPGVRASFPERLEQLTRLAREFGPGAIKLRFDPIVIYIGRPPAPGKAGTRTDNLGHFPDVLDRARELGIAEVIFAFCIAYPKVARRFTRAGLKLLNPGPNEKKKILDPLIDLADARGIRLRVCCDSPELIGYRGITASKCVDGTAIEALLPSQAAELFVPKSSCIGKAGKLRVNRAAPTRDKCGCTTSRDIGEYSIQCPHSCIYCYANK